MFQDVRYPIKTNISPDRSNCNKNNEIKWKNKTKYVNLVTHVPTT